MLPATLPLLLDAMPDDKVIAFIEEIGKIRQSSKLVERFMKEVPQIKLAEDYDNSWKSNSENRIGIGLILRIGLGFDSQNRGRADSQNRGRADSQNRGV